MAADEIVRISTQHNESKLKTKMDNLADDPGFIDAIVHEVKSQGLFDQFRKECLADVDTKPAYQNLRQRVESSVGKFLSQQKWTDNIRHKNQLREKLRKNIIDSGFLETGVERIVDQVVNPKISTVFHPKVEDIVYNYLGIEKPKPVVNGSGGLDVQTDFLPEDLEAVSPDSDKKSSSASSDIHPTMDQNQHEELNDSKEHIDDFESPAFEPLETRPPSQTKHESNDSNASAISGLTSQESVEDEPNDVAIQSVTGQVNSEIIDKHQANHADEEPVVDDMAPDSSLKASPEIAQNDSQLSQVSSNSRLSIITNSEGVVQQPQHQNQQQGALGNPRLDITEEAQMPKFNDNSNGEEGELSDSNDEAPGGASCELKPQRSNFDLRQEAYDFKGTERNRYIDADLDGIARERCIDRPDSGNSEGTAKDETMNNSGARDENVSPSIAVARYDENSSHSERSLRICEDSTLEQRTLDTGDRLENCDSAKTPLNDEHSTQSAPDVDKMDSSQVEVVVSLAAVQQHVSERDSRKDRHRSGRSDRDNDRKHSSSQRSSSSREERRSHGSSKHSGSSGNSSRRGDRDRDRKHENGNSNSNSGSSRKTHDKRKDDDDHYSSHEKPPKRRRSTDRDSNDGAENGKSAPTTAYSSGRTGESQDSAKDSQSTGKREGGPQDSQPQLNDSLDSSFEGFDEDQLNDNPTKMDKYAKILKKSTEKPKSGGSSAKVVKKIKKPNHRSPKDVDRKSSSNMDVFAFSFDKPAKLGKNGEMELDETRNMEEDLPDVDSIDNLDEGVIVLEPTELAKVIQANDQQDAQETASNTTDDDEIIQPTPPIFPKTNPEDLVTLATQPVIVDQMLTNGDNMDLELLIGEKQLCGDETTLDKIQQGLDVTKNRVRKPKIASNFSEARKLMKVRRQIEREEKKKHEQAMALAKKLITENGNEDDQGIELEFVCDKNRNSSGPIISSPVRQKAPKINCSLEGEPDLLYLPEEDQVYTANEKLLEFLKQKTIDVSVPDDFMLDNRLYSLDPTRCHEKTARNIFPDNEDEDEIMSVEVVEPLADPSVAKRVAISQPDNATEELPMPSKVRTSSIGSELSVERVEQAVKQVEKAATPKQRTSKRKHSRSPTNAMASTDVDFEACLPVQRITKSSSKIDDANIQPSKENVDTPIRASKARRVGLSKPKGTMIHNTTSTAILTVDISDVKPIAVDKGSPGNNNNGIIKAQRYSSDDLYKPRYNSRTRTRANEQVGI